MGAKIWVTRMGSTAKTNMADKVNTFRDAVKRASDTAEVDLTRKEIDEKNIKDALGELKGLIEPVSKA